MGEMMQAVIAEKGQALRLGEIAKPVCGSEDVLIEVKAAGLNRADLIQREGRYPPPPGAPDTMGLECAGIITEIGNGVTDRKIGDRVCALLAGGGYAEYAAVDNGSVLPLPEGMSFEHGACLAEAMMTVWANVFLRCGFKAGESFLQHGGTSGIGVMGIQMAKHAGASHIYTTAGTDEKTALCRELGADTAINYREQDFEAVVKAAGGADVILDMVGGDYVQKNINIANLNGRICNIAYQDGFMATVNFAMVLMKRLVITATTLRARTAAEKRVIRDAILADFWPAVEAGTIKPILDSTFPMADAEAAQAKMSEGGHIGKIVLTR